MIHTFYKPVFTRLFYLFYIVDWFKLVINKINTLNVFVWVEDCSKVVIMHYVN